MSTRLPPRERLLLQLVETEEKHRRLEDRLDRSPFWRFRRRRELNRALSKAEWREEATRTLLEPPEPPTHHHGGA